MIIKKGNKWQVQSEKGKNMGIYNTKAEAEKRLNQIEYFKNIKEEKEENIEKVELEKDKNKEEKVNNKVIGYHGSNKNFNKFRNDIRYKKPTLMWFAKDLKICLSYADTDDSYIYKCELNLKNALDITSCSLVSLVFENGDYTTDFKKLAKLLNIELEVLIQYAKEIAKKEYINFIEELYIFDLVKRPEFLQFIPNYDSLICRDEHDIMTWGVKMPEQIKIIDRKKRKEFKQQSSFKEEIKKQADVNYKGYTIIHFPVVWKFNDKNYDQESWLINSPYYLTLDNGQKMYLPLYTEDEIGEVVNFDTLQQAKDYIDNYLITNKTKIEIKHRDEVHAVVKDEFRQDLEEAFGDDDSLKRILKLISDYIGYDINEDEIDDIYYLAKKSKDYELIDLIKDYKLICKEREKYPELIGKTKYNEDIEKHNTLNPKLFDENNQLKPEVKGKILEIVDEFKSNLEEDGIKLDIKDIIIVGSNCSYNYNKDSDLDVHIKVDLDNSDCPPEYLALLYSAYRSIFNKKFDIDFYGIPVELYVETI